MTTEQVLENAVLGIKTALATSDSVVVRVTDVGLGGGLRRLGGTGEFVVLVALGVAAVLVSQFGLRRSSS